MQGEKVIFVQGAQVDGDITFVMGGARGGVIPVHKPPRNLPPRQSTFAGRESEHRELHERLSRDTEVGITQETAVHGHGGIGKTALSVEYGWRHLADYPGGIFFLNCDSDLPPPIAELAPHLGLENETTADETALRVKAHLETGERSLLILDDVRGPQQWRTQEWSRWLPGGACHRLITTRAESLPGMAMYALQRLTSEDGVRLLAGYRDDVEENRADAEAVVEWFDGLAVGLTVVGAYMKAQRRVSWKDYVNHLERKGLGVVRHTERAVGALPDYEARVDAVFDQLLMTLPAGQRRALEYSAVLPEDNVYVPWLPELLEVDAEVELLEVPGHQGSPGEPLVWALMDAQLLHARGEQEQVVGLHRVLRRRMRERLAEAGLIDELGNRVVELAARRGKASHRAVTYAAVRPELSSLLALSRELDDLGRPEAAASLASWVSSPVRDLGRFAEARALLDRFTVPERLDMLPVGLGAALLSNSAVVLHNLGELEEARRRMERAIEIDEATLGPDDPTLAIRYSNLAMILKDLGELKEARRQIECSIEIDERNFNPDHKTLAISYSNLAMILQDLGEFKEARRRIERAIEINERNFDSDHPVLATSYSNLATILKDLGDLEEARHQLERAIEIDERNFNPDHPTLAVRYSNLAAILKDLRKPDEARRQIEKAIQIEERNFNPDHPMLATSYSNLAMILNDLGEFGKARRWVERAIEIDERNFGPDHPKLAIRYNNLAYVEMTSGDRVRACILFHRAKAILEKHFAPTHPRVIMVTGAINRYCPKTL